ncbi:MAG: thioredoxin family protein, partial [Rubrivivax sp.]|nr:thioredoxin family protein [Rubrivivax sp.]
VCKDVCIPESGEFALSVPAQAATGGHAALFDAARAALPRAVPGAKAKAAVEGDAVVVQVEGLPAAWRGRTLLFLPETAGVIANAAPQQAAWNGERWQTRVPLDPQRSESPTAMPAVLVATSADGQPAPVDGAAGLAVTVSVTTPWPQASPTPGAPVAAIAPPAPVPSTAPSVAGGSSLGLPMALVFALIGGALLNLMPCVFPVLSLKVLGLAAPGSRGRLASGVAYSAGVVVSFVLLAALLISLRAGGEQLGWGFQLQNPYVVAGLAALFTLIGLNLAGVYEIGSLLPNRLACARAEHPLADDLLTGVLAVAVAAPCTAPFMGAAMGVAMTLPPVQGLAIFAALGVGMSLPYLLLAASPALARQLPRPGVWMQHFKVLMAFPMLGTVVWLVWVLGQQVGIDGAAALLGALLALAFCAWALGSPTLGRKGHLWFGAASAFALLVALAWALPSLAPNGGAHARADAAQDHWQPWSPARVAELNGQGKAVFVDYTAAWCVTCQFNKRTVLRQPTVLDDFARRGVVPMRADWTRRDPAITAELQRLNRTGVPVYALYRPGHDAPLLLTEILSVQEVRDALATLN